MELSYLFALIPLYLFIYLPASQKYWPNNSSAANSPRRDAEFSYLNESFIAREDARDSAAGNVSLSCAPHAYDTHILSREPLVIYIENFLTDDEITHLVDTSDSKFSLSSVLTGAEGRVDPAIRLSETATLDRDDVVRCIETRARAFQGWRADLMLERLKIQRYRAEGHYSHHFDWGGGGRVDRVSTFMVYVKADCVGGGTEFPRLPRPADRRWCKFLECPPETEDGALGQGLTTEGTTFLPVQGNAVYWENLRTDGSGYPETFHAGLPVINGTKIGLNIWSWAEF